MDYKAAAKQLAGGKAMPVYVCYGIETYLLQEFVRFAVSHMVGEENADMAVSKYDLSETSLAIVLEDAETPSFFTERKVIIASNAALFTSAKDSSKIDHPVDRLIQYLGAPSDQATILFTVEAEKLDERKKVVKAVKEAGAAVPFMPMSAGELTRWVQKQFDKHGSVCDNQAIDRLILYAGTKLQTLAAEIEKLCLFAGSGVAVSEDDIERLVVRGTEQNVFILIDDIVRRRLDKALFLLHELLKQKEEPVKIALLIARQFRIMIQAKELSGQGMSGPQIASALGLHPYAVKTALEQSRAYDESKLKDALAHLANLDYKMKSGAIDKVLGLELFLFKLAS